ncbi:MAG: hypothetical protein DMD87_24840 [Candidatus Rokuibacteriota bacterium]|nr:MAG: hypothetical protein DMD87_24840 [Candidatus Rokubacteria bacterium]
MAHADSASSSGGPAASRVESRSTRLPTLVLATCLVLAVLVGAPAAQPDCRTIEDFSKAKVGELPADWKLRKDSGKDVYRVVEESGLRFLRATAKGLGIQAAKEYEWDLDAHPMLVWSWRALEFPKGADERDSKTNDSVLAVYMLVPYSRVRGPKAVKYIWSEKVPVGTRLESNMGLTHVRVLRSGAPEKKGEWVEERVNVLEDYQKSFGVKETPKPAGIAVLTDSDDTNSSAQGDYANFRVCRQ